MKAASGPPAADEPLLPILAANSAAASVFVQQHPRCAAQAGRFSGLSAAPACCRPAGRAAAQTAAAPAAPPARAPAQSCQREWKAHVGAGLFCVPAGKPRLAPEQLLTAVASAPSRRAASRAATAAAPASCTEQQRQPAPAVLQHSAATASNLLVGQDNFCSPASNAHLRSVMEMRRAATGGTQCIALSPPYPFSTHTEPGEGWGSMQEHGVRQAIQKHTKQQGSSSVAGRAGLPGGSWMVDGGRRASTLTNNLRTAAYDNMHTAASREPHLAAAGC